MKRKYYMAVAILVVAAAFSACDNRNDAEFIPISRNESVITNESGNTIGKNESSGVKDSPANDRYNDSSQDELNGNSNINYKDNSNQENNQNTNQISSQATHQYSGQEKNQETNQGLNQESNKGLSQGTTQEGLEKKDKRIYVYICGAVIDPNVYEIRSDARIVDLVNMAGGFTKDAGKEYVNLASSIYDGQKIYIPSYEDIESDMYTKEELLLGLYSNVTSIDINSENANSGSGNIGSTNSSSTNPGSANTRSTDLGNTSSENKNSGNANSGKVNINTATEAELMTIPGVGQSKAGKIIDYRNENGGFSQIEDIMFITGIKEGMFNKIKDYITVE